MLDKKERKISNNQISNVLSGIIAPYIGNSVKQRYATMLLEGINLYYDEYPSLDDDYEKLLEYRRSHPAYELGQFLGYENPDGTIYFVDDAEDDE